MENRLSEISRCTDELARIRAWRAENPVALREDHLGALMGELDWLSELHFLLHDVAR